MHLLLSLKLMFQRKKLFPFFPSYFLSLFFFFKFSNALINISSGFANTHSVCVLWQIICPGGRGEC